MSIEIVLVVVFSINLINADNWIKLPDIKPQGHIRAIKHELPSVVFKLAPSPEQFSSDVMNSVFSLSSTTESPIITASSTMRSYTKRYFQSTVTSKILGFPSNVSELMEDFHDELPMNLKPPRVKFFNQTTSFSVVTEKTANKVINDDQNEEEEEEEDDGVTITDDINDSMEDYYEDDYPIEVPSTTTNTPRREHKVSAKSNETGKKSQRRVIVAKPKPDLNFSSFLKFIKTIQESLAIKTAKTINEKVKMLMEFRDSLMTTINQQIRRLWKTQPKINKKQHKRVKRTFGEGLADKGGAMDFPSSEGALLSICFLTFAVFLIKLVLQVIHTIKMKKAMWAAQMMTNDAAQNVVIKRHRRSDEDEKFYDLAKTLEAIHQLKV